MPDRFGYGVSWPADTHSERLSQAQTVHQLFIQDQADREAPGGDLTKLDWSKIGLRDETRRKRRSPRRWAIEIRLDFREASIFFVLKVNVGALDQPCRQPNLAKESGPVERGLPEKLAQLRLGSPIQQPETNLFGPKTRCAYQGRVALLAVFAVPLKIKISTGLK